ncbi:hypothetical protein Q0N71_29265, partial [Bacillus thuringiensis]|uniref:hypothetical protein n=1 Tax=Bacillus thuringiensis TaxID=1428 RepID=UPI00346F629B
VDPGWVYLYNKAYYVKKDNTWTINEKLTIDGKIYSFNSEGIAAPEKSVNVYTNYQSDTVQVLRNGNVKVRATYTLATGSMKSVDPGWVYLYNKAYYVKKDNTWTINEKLTIDGKIYSFNSEGIAAPIETQEVKDFGENKEQARK